MKDTSSDLMVSLLNSINPYLLDNWEGVRYAFGWLVSSRSDLPWTTTTTPGKCVDCSVLTVTAISSEGIEMRLCFGEWPTTLINELVGSFRRSESLFVERKEKVNDS